MTNEEWLLTHRLYQLLFEYYHSQWPGIRGSWGGSNPVHIRFCLWDGRSLRVAFNGFSAKAQDMMAIEFKEGWPEDVSWEDVERLVHELEDVEALVRLANS
jgi:hypothetical protein